MRGHSSERHISGGNPISFGGGSNASHEFVNWREVDVLANDPDQPYDDRLQNFAKAGFKLATGIPFGTFSCVALALRSLFHSLLTRHFALLHRLQWVPWTSSFLGESPCRSEEAKRSSQLPLHQTRRSSHWVQRRDSGTS